MAEVKERLAPFLNGSYADVAQVVEEIKQVGGCGKEDTPRCWKEGKGLPK